MTEEWDNEQGIDYRALLTKLIAGWRWILGSTVLVAGAFAVVAYLLTPVYRASTVLVAASSDRGAGGVLGNALGELGGLAAMAGINVGVRDSETEEALAVLQSRQFTEAFINDKGLLPKLFADKWDPTSKTWKTRDGAAPTAAKAFRYFNKKVRSIVRDKKTGLITLNIDWRDGDEAAAWANELIQRVNEEMRARAVQNAEASVGFLERELLVTTSVSGRQAIGRLMEAQVKQRMLANVTQEYALRVVDKAMPADRDDPLRPKKLQIIATGLLIGTLVGVLLVLVFGSFRSNVSDVGRS